MNELAYKANAAEVCARLRLLTTRQAQDQIFAAFILPTQAMKDFQKQYAGGFSAEYPDPAERVRFWDRHLGEHRLIEDDSIPAAYPSEFDQGLYGGILGGDVRFLSLPEDGYVGSGWISSMVPPLLADWSEFEHLRFSEDSLWYQRYLRQLNLMRDAAHGKFGISHLIVIDSFNFIYELVGATNTYLSMFEAPARVREAIEFAYHLNLKIHNAFFDIVGTLDGGTCSWVAPWIPGRIICQSIDPFHMTSTQDFEKWGQEPLERLAGQYDGAVLHLHANGWHQLEAACELRGIQALLLVDEKDHRPAIEIGHELRQRAGDMPLSMLADYDSFVAKLDAHLLPGGVFYYVSGAPDADAVNRYMEKVRQYRV